MASNGSNSKQKTIVEAHIALLKKMKSVTVEAGWFESARYQGGKDVPAAQVGMSVAQVARYNEFGTFSKSGNQHIPPRPFMRGAYIKIVSKRGDIQKRITKQMFEGKITPDQAMIQIGAFMEGEIVESIKNGGWTPNAPSTEKRKGFNTPLIHTGQMWQTVASKVSEAT